MARPVLFSCKSVSKTQQAEAFLPRLAQNDRLMDDLRPLDV